MDRLFFGANKVMQVSLGRTASDEIQPGLYKVSKLLHGNTGLCFTNLPKEEVERLFNEYVDYDYARTGSEATEKVELKEGPLEQFSHEMEPSLRKLGLPCSLEQGSGIAGVVELVSDFTVCEEGKSLSPESAGILRALGIRMATFRLNLVCRWSPGEFELYIDGPDNSDIETA
ncbi:mRNA turnover protein 4-like protein, partial [Cucurbita argyrosperma subsp. argyrosperma]